MCLLRDGFVQSIEKRFNGGVDAQPSSQVDPPVCAAEGVVAVQPLAPGLGRGRVAGAAARQELTQQRFGRRDGPQLGRVGCGVE